MLYSPCAVWPAQAHACLASMQRRRRLVSRHHGLCKDALYLWPVGWRPDVVFDTGGLECRAPCLLPGAELPLAVAFDFGQDVATVAGELPVRHARVRPGHH